MPVVKCVISVPAATTSSVGSCLPNWHDSIGVLYSCDETKTQFLGVSKLHAVI